MEVLKYFPIEIQKKIKDNLNFEEESKLEEIRIRNCLPIILRISNNEKILDYIISNEDMEYIFQKICENSIYAYQKQIANGFITIKGGNRVGIVGTAVLNNDNEIINFNYISSLNFRISRQVIGCSNEILDKIYNEQGQVLNTLIVAKPGMGKTTLLRDIIRNISNGIENKYIYQNVTVIDERGEIAAMFRGKSGNDLGIRTDVINNVPKELGIKIAIRSMAPQVIVADEIGSKEDIKAIRYAILSGTKGIFTAHGNSIEDIRKNKDIVELIEDKVIQNIIVIKDRINGKYVI